MSKINYDLIIFTGHMASGKSYYSTLLKTQLEKINKENNNNKVSNYFFKEAHIAGKLKEVAKDVFGMKEKDRRLLQMLGSKMREIDPDVWIKYISRQISNDINEGQKTGIKDVYIIDDVRFKNEIDYLKKIKIGLEQIKVLIVNIQPRESERLDKYKELYGRYPTKEELNDSTEKEIDSLPYNYKIKNAKYDNEFAKKQINYIIHKFIIS